MTAFPCRPPSRHSTLDPDHGAPRHARALHPGQYYEQNLFGDGVARGLGAWPPDLTGSIRKVHDFLTVGAAAPLQHAGVLALGLPDAYYVQLSQPYAARRDHLVTSLQSIGFNCLIPRGAYYVMTDISSFGFADDASFGAPSDHRRRSGGSARVEFFFECKR